MDDCLHDADADRLEMTITDADAVDGEGNLTGKRNIICRKAEKQVLKEGVMECLHGSDKNITVCIDRCVKEFGNRTTCEKAAESANVPAAKAAEMSAEEDLKQCLEDGVKNITSCIDECLHGTVAHNLELKQIDGDADDGEGNSTGKRNIICRKAAEQLLTEAAVEDLKQCLKDGVKNSTGCMDECLHDTDDDDLEMKVMDGDADDGEGNLTGKRTHICRKAAKQVLMDGIMECLNGGDKNITVCIDECMTVGFGNRTACEKAAEPANVPEGAGVNATEGEQTKSTNEASPVRSEATTPLPSSPDDNSENPDFTLPPLSPGDPGFEIFNNSLKAKTRQVHASLFTCLLPMCLWTLSQ